MSIPIGAFSAHLSPDFFPRQGFQPPRASRGHGPAHGFFSWIQGRAESGKFSELHLKQEILALEREPNPRLRWAGFSQLAGRLQFRGEETGARRILEFIADPRHGAPVELRESARREREGTGPFGTRMEAGLRRWGTELMAPLALALGYLPSLWGRAAFMLKLGRSARLFPWARLGNIQKSFLIHRTPAYEAVRLTRAPRVLAGGIRPPMMSVQIEMEGFHRAGRPALAANALPRGVLDPEVVQARPLSSHWEWDPSEGLYRFRFPAEPTRGVYLGRRDFTSWDAVEHIRLFGGLHPEHVLLNRMRDQRTFLFLPRKSSAIQVNQQTLTPGQGKEIHHGDLLQLSPQVALIFDAR